MEKFNDLIHHDTDCNTYTGHDLDKEYSDAVDDKLDSIVPWFLMATYARDVEKDPILSPSCYERMMHRLADDWKEIKHPYKENLTLDNVKRSVYIEEYPPRVEAGLGQLRGAYKIGEKFRK